MRSLADVIGSRPRQEERDIDIDSDGLEQQAKLYQILRYRADTKNRNWLGIWTATIVSIWLIVVVWILLNNASIGLSDMVLIALLGTTTLNVLGLSFIVIRGHFNSIGKS